MTDSYHDAENWDLLQTLFFLAEEVSAEERERTLTERCQDAALVDRVLRMLNEAKAPTGAESDPRPSATSLRAGPYTLLRVLGRNIRTRYPMPTWLCARSGSRILKSRFRPLGILYARRLNKTTR